MSSARLSTAAWDGNCPRPAYDRTMITFLTILVALAMAGTLGVLLVGVFGIASGNPERSNRLMRWRIVLQAVALLLFMLLLSLLRS